MAGEAKGSHLSMDSAKRSSTLEKNSRASRDISLNIKSEFENNKCYKL
jgi:hypothetical protein